MTPAPHNRRFSRVSARRQSEQGLTLIELLLSLAILAILTGFLAGGLFMGRRAFAADHANQVASETSAAIQTIAGLIGSALPTRPEEAGQHGEIGFEGREEVLSFVGLSEGRSLPGGPHRIVLRRNGNDVVADFAASNGSRSKGSREPAATSVVVLSGVHQVRLRYFGTTDTKAKPSWRADWPRVERLPNLVSIQIEFEDERRNAPATIVALRQG